MPTRRQSKVGLLVDNGFRQFEAREIASQYSVTQMRTLPYLVNVRRSRILYVGNLQRRGYSDSQIAGLITNLYYRRGWLTPDGKLDVWKMIRDIRKDAIDSGDYIPPKRKGGHHPKGVSKGDVEGQRKRSNIREKFARRRELQNQLGDLERQWRQAMNSGDQARVQSLNRQMDRIRDGLSGA